MDEKRLYYLAFSHFLGIGPHRLSLLLNRFGDVKSAYRAPIKEISLIIGSAVAEKFARFRHNFNAVTRLRELESKRIRTIYLEESTYPPSLKNINDPPLCLYVRGQWEIFDFAKDHFIAMVGTRNPTGYGECMSRKFAPQLVKAGFTVVSGMALGIDCICQKSALDAGGKTIAVLGCGVDIVYPAVHSQLYWRIAGGGGVVMSEFPPGHTVLKGLFVSRNRLISGLSKGIIVIEGGKDSGTLITVKYAAQQGKEVFALPGPINSRMSDAPNLLLKQGAKMITSVEDVLEEYGFKMKPAGEREIRAKLTAEEQKILDCLLKDAFTTDELAYALKKTTVDTLKVITLMEIKGIVGKLSDGKFHVIS